VPLTSAAQIGATLADLLLSILVFTLPVLAIVGLAIFFNRRLSGSCGGVGPDGACTKCGKRADEMPSRTGDTKSCP